MNQALPRGSSRLVQEPQKQTKKEYNLGAIRERRTKYSRELIVPEAIWEAAGRESHMELLEIDMEVDKVQKVINKWPVPIYIQTQYLEVQTDQSDVYNSFRTDLK